MTERTARRFQADQINCADTIAATISGKSRPRALLQYVRKRLIFGLLTLKLEIDGASIITPAVVTRIIAVQC
jgi:hypothetical protein